MLPHKMYRLTERDVIEKGLEIYQDLFFYYFTIVRTTLINF